MSKGHQKTKVDGAEVGHGSEVQTKQFMPSQRYPASCPGCGTNSRITVATGGIHAGNKLDCDNCGYTYTWS